MIYNTIHQSWSSKILPVKYLKIKLKNKQILSNWNFKLWTDDDNDLFIEEKFPSFLDIYKNYKHKIHKIDAIRYFYLYEYGGLYMDLDITLNKNITNLLKSDKCCLFSQKAINDYFYTNGYGEYIDPMIMYSPPKHKFIKSIIDKLHSNGVVENIFDNVYDNMKVAGPAFLTDFFNKKNNDSLIIKNKIITEKNKEHYKKYYGIHLCDNNWLKYE